MRITAEGIYRVIQDEARVSHKSTKETQKMRITERDLKSMVKKIVREAPYDMTPEIEAVYGEAPPEDLDMVEDIFEVWLAGVVEVGEATEAQMRMLSREIGPYIQDMEPGDMFIFNMSGFSTPSGDTPQPISVTATDRGYSVSWGMEADDTVSVDGAEDVVYVVGVAAVDSVLFSDEDPMGGEEFGPPGEFEDPADPYEDLHTGYDEERETERAGHIASLSESRSIRQMILKEMADILPLGNFQMRPSAAGGEMGGEIVDFPFQKMEDEPLDAGNASDALKGILVDYFVDGPESPGLLSLLEDFMSGSAVGRKGVGSPKRRAAENIVAMVEAMLDDKIPVVDFHAEKGDEDAIEVLSSLHALDQIISTYTGAYNVMAEKIYDVVFNIPTRGSNPDTESGRALVDVLIDR